MARNVKRLTGRRKPVERPLGGFSSMRYSSMIGGWHIYRRDPGDSGEHILAQGLSRDEASVCCDALTALARRGAACGARSGHLRCALDPGHTGHHATSGGLNTWTDAACDEAP